MTKFLLHEVERRPGYEDTKEKNSCPVSPGSRVCVSIICRNQLRSHRPAACGKGGSCSGASSSESRLGAWPLGLEAMVAPVGMGTRPLEIQARAPVGVHLLAGRRRCFNCRLAPGNEAFLPSFQPSPEAPAKRMQPEG